MNKSLKRKALEAELSESSLQAINVTEGCAGTVPDIAIEQMARIDRGEITYDEAIKEIAKYYCGK